jgi:hypothetical protein
MWYNPVHHAPDPPKGTETAKSTITWLDILTHWDLIQADFLALFGIDLASGILKERSLEWLNSLVKVVTSSPASRLSLKMSRPG